jgi:hypothetical protein
MRAERSQPEKAPQLSDFFHLFYKLVQQRLIKTLLYQLYSVYLKTAEHGFHKHFSPIWGFRARYSPLIFVTSPAKPHFALTRCLYGSSLN